MGKEFEPKATLCPFRKKFVREIGEDGELKYYDSFCKCLGTKCMAFREGECLRLEATSRFLVNNHFTNGDQK